MKKAYQLILPLVLFACLVGCASSVRVSVELIQPPKNEEFIASYGGPTIIDAVQGAVAGLETYKKDLAPLYTKYDTETVLSYLPLQSELLLTTQDNSVDKSIDEGLKLLSEAENSKDAASRDRYYLANKMRLYTISVSNLCASAQQILEKQKQSVKKDADKIAKDQKDIDDALSAFDKVIQGFNIQISEAVTTSQKSGFGGFSTVGTYTITPGDPAYREIVHSPSLGVISEARTYASGDSTIIFVQETPTEMKNICLDLDATKLIKNTAKVSDKVMAAYVKYMGVTP